VEIARSRKGFTIKVIIDEGECLLNSFFKEITISKSVDKNFGTNTKGNLLTCLDATKSQMFNNTKQSFNKQSPTFVGCLSALSASSETFEDYQFKSQSPTTKKNNDLKILIKAKKGHYEDFTVFHSIDSIKVISSKKGDAFLLCKILNNNTLLFNVNTFAFVAEFKKK